MGTDAEVEDALDRAIARLRPAVRLPVVGGIGMALFAGFVYAISQSQCDTGDCDYSARENAVIVLSGAALGAVGGGLIGAGLGSGVPRWHLRYTAPPHHPCTSDW